MAIPFGERRRAYSTRISTVKTLTFLAFLIACLPRSADAQGAYVSASLTGEVVRLDRVETAGGRDQSNSGETLGFALRVGTELGMRWGVELEFLRPAEIETEFSPGIVPLAFDSSPLTFTDLTNLTNGTTSVVFPSFSYRFRTRQRTTTLSSALWARQQISSGISLVYLGGVGFHHRTEEATISFTPSPLPALPGIPTIPIVLPPASVSTATTYDVGPFAGVEARIGLTTHVQLVPGVRLHGINGGWLLRPSVGLGWTF